MNRIAPYYLIGRTWSARHVGQTFEWGEKFHFPEEKGFDFLVAAERYTVIPGAEKRELDHDYIARKFCSPEPFPEFPRLFPFYGIRETLLDVDFPHNEPMPPGQSTNLPIVSRAFIDFLNDYGFYDYRTYPIRVILINDYRDRLDPNGRFGLADVKRNIGRFEHSDDMFCVFQLTNQPVDLVRRRKEGLPFIEHTEGDHPTLPFLFRVTMPGYSYELLGNQDFKDALAKTNLNITAYTPELRRGT